MMSKKLIKISKNQKRIVICLIGLLLVFVDHNIWQNSISDTNSNLCLLNTSTPVGNQSSNIFGNILLKTENDLSLGHAHVLIKGIPQADFEGGKIFIRVYPGDIVSIDASDYQRELCFELTAISSNIDNAFLKNKIYTDGTSVDAGIIVYK